MRSVLVLLSLLLVACASTPEADPFFELEGISASEELRAELSASRRLSAPAPPRLAEVERFLDWERRVQDPDQREAVADELFAAWSGDPTNFAYVDFGARFSRLLGRVPDRNAMYALPELSDSTSAVGLFVRGRRFFGFSSRGEHIRAAHTRIDELDPLQRIWLERMRAQVDLAEGDPAAAAHRLRAQLKPAREIGGRGLEAYLWLDLAHTLTRDDRLDDALHAAHRAGELALARGQSMEVVWARQELANVLEARNETRAALSVLDESQESLRGEGSSRLRARLLNQAATLAGTLGDYPAKLRLHRESLELSRATRDSIFIPRALVNLADTHLMRGEVDSCAVLLQRAHAAVNAFPHERNRLGLAEHEAIFRAFLGDYAAADSLFHVAQSGPAGATTVDEQAALLLEVLRLARDSGQVGRAHSVLQRLETLRPRLSAGRADQNLVADLEIASAELWAAQGEVLRAADALDRADAAVRSSGGENKAWEVSRARGELALQRDDAETARRALARCVTLAEASGAHRWLPLSRVLYGTTLLRAGRPDEVLALLADVDDEHGGFRTRISTQLLRATAYLALDEPERALEVLDRAQSFAWTRTPSDLLARMHLRRGQALERAGRWNEAAVEWRSGLQELDAARPEGGTPELLFEGRDDRRALTEALLSVYAAHPDRFGEDASAESTLELAASCLGDAHPVRSGPWTSGPGDVALITFVGTARSFAWTVAEGKVVQLSLPGRDRLRAWLSTFLVELTDPTRAPDPRPGAALGQALLGPVASLWPAGGTLAVAPDGLLDAVPWAALPWVESGDSAPYVIEHGGIVEVEAGMLRGDGDWSARTAPPRSARLLGIGVDAGDRDRGTLRHAEAEARTLAADWPAHAETWLGAEASAERLRREDLSRFDVIHIASHARVLRGRRDQSTLRLSGREGETALGLDDVARLRLGARLVFLSCCEAATRTQTGGTGISDFARAFHRAGATCVIAPSAPIVDEAARALAISFYRHWLSGLDEAAALRAAQLEALRGDEWAHPHYWAGYRCLLGPERATTGRT